MSSLTDGPYGPLIPMPELTPDRLRAAVARIAPSQIPALTQHLFEATTNAQQTQTLAPLRAFVHSWAVFVAIERYPERAARLRELERIVEEGKQDPAQAIDEIRAIREAAEAEAGLRDPRP
ncbi:hypothetical protein QQY66_20420 [Streptomyces sp. DG2A-72]|uniref:DUF6247 family protein n=1 Tax=Streptomyces sp. DG2A-72 TaxID=3051386 RepID=UPI00265BD10F|nr:DUF6247 family protein [Streptomyces sp. DG2A-72]MDO0933932.1 hypothetical protein [Streptomyces sp. DG2A-72]